jgi:hypothetical protein
LAPPGSTLPCRTAVVAVTLVGAAVSTVSAGPALAETAMATRTGAII